VIRAIVLIATVACHEPPPVQKTGTPQDLAEYLRTVAGADTATRTREVTGWILDETTWSRDIVDPFRSLYGEYVKGFDAQVPAMVARLASLGPVTARRHFAGDPRALPSQIRTRWTVPVQFPSAVAELGGQPIDAVFIHDGAHWRALLGLDQLVVQHVAALDPTCAAKLQLAGRRTSSSRCTEVAWLVADSALRAQPERFAHACKLASTLCGNPVP
jgi:hypothetical protein